MTLNDNNTDFQIMVDLGSFGRPNYLFWCHLISSAVNIFFKKYFVNKLRELYGKF